MTLISVFNFFHFPSCTDEVYYRTPPTLPVSVNGVFFFVFFTYYYYFFDLPQTCPNYGPWANCGPVSNLKKQNKKQPRMHSGPHGTWWSLHLQHLSQTNMALRCSWEECGPVRSGTASHQMIQRPYWREGVTVALWARKHVGLRSVISYNSLSWIARRS